MAFFQCSMSHDLILIIVDTDSFNLLSKYRKVKIRLNKILRLKMLHLQTGVFETEVASGLYLLLLKLMIN